MKFLQLSRDFQLRSKMLTVQNSYNLLCRNFDAGLAECCHHERISLLAYSPMAMGILSGKYHSSDDSGPLDARMNLFKGRYSEGESRYNLQNPKLESAVKEYTRIGVKYGISPSTLAVGVLPQSLCSFQCCIFCHQSLIISSHLYDFSICTETPPRGVSCFRCY